MGAWTDSLPAFDKATPREHFIRALGCLQMALSREDRGELEWMAEWSQMAAARVVAWRRSLPDQGERFPDAYTTFTDRQLLRVAVINLVNAEEGGARYLRMAEACLRTLWKRHQP